LPKSKHVVENDIECTYTLADLPAGATATDTTVEFWGDDSIETGYEAELNSYGALARGRSAGLLHRTERDLCWLPGSGAFKQFRTFSQASSSSPAGKLVGSCVKPGFQTGFDGVRGPRGYTGSGPPGPAGPSGTINWVPTP